MPLLPAQVSDGIQHVSSRSSEVHTHRTIQYKVTGKIEDLQDISDTVSHHEDLRSRGISLHDDSTEFHHLARKYQYYK